MCVDVEFSSVSEELFKNDIQKCLFSGVQYVAYLWKPEL
jgi:hypothetical protein